MCRIPCWNARFIRGRVGAQSETITATTMFSRLRKRASVLPTRRIAQDNLTLVPLISAQQYWLLVPPFPQSVMVRLLPAGQGHGKERALHNPGAAAD